ncbi:hypothetical protein HDF19_06655 [Mucilaginibacter sp. E4BP6]|uniref:hypothetical protein n=1 Tax=Mucilaginibacter sp. E4BP6 TaxID=2723089 RepID=UPI0015CE8C90|nr:hypothetical protein [Mucilaginibacter sp. E4BP6]NYE68408.1 hypothetical protein [Mucilaginibacter sp. E4BP6]
MNFLEATWYCDEDGNHSPYASHLYEQTETWRKAYWANFEQSLAIKTKEWEYEQEYRLTISGHFTDYKERDSRKLQYRFEDLKGLIFGIKTASLDKLRIMRIINEKCKSTGRTDFKFCQAYYSRATKQIEHQEIHSFDLGAK